MGSPRLQQPLLCTLLPNSQDRNLIVPTEQARATGAPPHNPQNPMDTLQASQWQTQSQRSGVPGHALISVTSDLKKFLNLKKAVLDCQSIFVTFYKVSG